MLPFCTTAASKLEIKKGPPHTHPQKVVGHSVDRFLRAVFHSILPLPAGPLECPVAVLQYRHAHPLSPSPPPQIHMYTLPTPTRYPPQTCFEFCRSAPILSIARGYALLCAAAGSHARADGPGKPVRSARPVPPTHLPCLSTYSPLCWVTRHLGRLVCARRQARARVRSCAYVHVHHPVCTSGTLSWGKPGGFSAA